MGADQRLGQPPSPAPRGPMDATHPRLRRPANLGALSDQTPCRSSGCLDPPT
jgi:hypothetical protein